LVLSLKTGSEENLWKTTNTCKIENSEAWKSGGLNSGSLRPQIAGMLEVFVRKNPKGAQNRPRLAPPQKKDGPQIVLAISGNHEILTSRRPKKMPFAGL
jgi:hypothetical protein